MKKLTGWFNSHSKRTKTLIIIGLILNIVFSVFNNDIIDQGGISFEIGLILGSFLGIMLPVVIVSGIISLILYYIFNKIAEDLKKYLDYFSVVFILITLILIITSLSIPKHIY